MSVDDVSAHLDVPKSWVYGEWKSQGIPFKKIGQKLKCRRTELEKWIDAQEAR
ncbi:helix-turn-helix domain-containing protein [Streptomyces sp. CA-106110]|uniref:helix-turn-helix domain-containing protein n=1 Tax=Streptomyces sp. CA-106110 TaxID=3240044 RepID=UPI003D8C8EE8